MTNPLRVAYVLASMAESYGGPPRSTRGLGEALQGMGEEVSYWASATPEEEDALQSTPGDIRLFPREWPLGWYRSSRLREALTEELRGGKLDLLHIQEIWSHPQWAAAAAGRKEDVPYIVTPRGILERWKFWGKGIPKYLKKVTYLSTLGKSFIRGAACYNALVPVEIEGIRQAGYRGPITVIPNGVDARLLETGADPAQAEEIWPELRDRKVVLFLSRLSSEKGLDELVPAWSSLMKRKGYEDALLVLAGPDDRGYRDKVEQSLHDHDAWQNVLLPGMVKGEAKEALLARADLYTLPSHSEGFSMSVLENLAVGTPALITPGCHFPEVAETGAGLCVEPESGALEEGLRDLLDLSESERISMGEKGRNLVRGNYTWEIAARKMRTVYKSVLAGKEIPLHPEPDSVEPSESRRFE